jgi:hypothetical protein
MYQKLPFDKAEAIITHSEGVLRSIKDDKESILSKRSLSKTK